MNPKHWGYGILLGALLSGSATAGGAEDRPLQVEREITRYMVNPDGSYVEAREVAIKVLKEAALAMAKDSSISYSSSIQTAEVVAAYTLKADGRRIDAPPGNFQLVSRSGQNGESPFYSDRTTMTVVFPELAVGDTTVFSYRLTALKPMFEGHFSVIQSFNPASYYGDVKVLIDVPETLVAQHQAWQMKETGNRRANGRSIVEWTWHNRKPVDPETLKDSVFNVERYPGYAFSTFRDYAQIAQAYGAQANAKAVPTARIHALAAEIAGDAEEPRAIAKRLYEWVAGNITYAGNCIGLGAVVPRDIDVVLDNRMGDCKDQATLLQSLLAAKGVASTQALVNAGGTYQLPKVPVASVVNHVINYIPSLDLYADPTATTVPFGSLPDGSAGKPVLLVDGHRDGLATPARTAGHDWQRMSTVLRIQPDGSVRGTQQLELGGRLAVAARSQFRDMSANDSQQLVKRYFQQSALKAEGTLDYADPKPLLDHFALDATFDVEQMIPVPGGMQIEPWFISLAPVSGIVARNLGSGEQAPGESSCGSVLSDEEYVFEFPETLRIAALPNDLSLQQGHVAYAASYRQEENRVHVKRTLHDRTPGPVCTAQYNADYAQLMRRIMPDLRSQIVYLKKEVP